MAHGVLGKLRLDRGVLRWWLIVAGLFLVDATWTRFLIGCGMVWLAAGLHLLCKAYLSQNRELTQTGPYRYSRNPFYLANFIAECGLLVIIGNWILAAIYLPVWFFVYGRQIRSEESKLVHLFGDAFQAYRAAVPRLFPLPWRVGRHRGSTFSLRNRNITDERAVERSVRLASYPLLLAAMDQVHDLGWGAVDGFNDWAPWLALGFVLMLLLGLLSSAILPRMGGQHTVSAA